MKKAAFILFLFFSCCLKAQIKDSLIHQVEFSRAVSRLSQNIALLKKANETWQSEISALKVKNDSLAKQLAESNSELQKVDDSLKMSVSNLSSENNKNQQRFDDVKQSLSQKTILW